MALKLKSIKADLDREHGGDWVPYKLPEWDEAIELKVRAFSYPPYQAARSAFMQKAVQRVQAGRDMTDDESRAENAKMLVEHILIDWRNIADDNGALIEYNKATALEYLADPAYRELLSAVESCAIRVAKISAEFVEESVKN